LPQAASHKSYEKPAKVCGHSISLYPIFSQPFDSLPHINAKVNKKFKKILGRTRTGDKKTAATEKLRQS